MSKVIKVYIDKTTTIKAGSKIIDWEWNITDLCMDILIEEDE